MDNYKLEDEFDDLTKEIESGDRLDRRMNRYTWICNVRIHTYMCVYIACTCMCEYVTNLKMLPRLYYCELSLMMQETSTTDDQYARL